jgi:hypothetical protein
MTTNYPASIDNFVNPAGTATLASPDHAGQHTDINDAVEAIETELGTLPKGSKASVKARLDDVDTAITARAVLASANTFTTSPQTINGATSAIGLIVKANATTPGDLQQWQNSSGTILANITSAGGIETNGGMRFYTSSTRTGFSTLGNTSGNLSFNYLLTLTGGFTSTRYVQIDQTNAGELALRVKGAASQTADLQQWQNSAGTVLMRVTAGGNVGIPTANTDASLTVSKTITGATTAYGIAVNGSVQSDVTSDAQGFVSSITTAASAFTLTSLTHFSAPGLSTPGAGSTITNQFGFRVTGNMTGATNNYAFRSTLASGTGRWNLYMDGTAANHLAGNLCVGTTAIATSADKAIHMGNGTAPTANIASGGILYVEAGALKYRGSSGTITTIANA